MITQGRPASQGEKVSGVRHREVSYFGARAVEQRHGKCGRIQNRLNREYFTHCMNFKVWRSLQKTCKHAPEENHHLDADSGRELMVKKELHTTLLSFLVPVH